VNTGQSAQLGTSGNSKSLPALPTESVTEEYWDRVLAVNLKGQLLCAQEAGKQMIKQNFGKTINMSSVAGIVALKESAAYSASKAGVILANCGASLKKSSSMADGLKSY